MKIKVKKIDGEEFTAETNQTMEELFREISSSLERSFILLGDRIIQKSIIEQIEVA